MIKDFWCWLWGHNTTIKTFDHPKGDGWYYIRKAEFCKRCGKDLKND